MKKIKKLKLFELEKNELNKSESKLILGGDDPGNCECGCGGPSSMQDNSAANYRYGYSDSGGEGIVCWCEGGGMSHFSVKRD